MRRHWRRLVKNIAWANQNIERGQKGVKSDKCMGVSQLLRRHVPGLPPKSTPMTVNETRLRETSLRGGGINTRKAPNCRHNNITCVQYYTQLSTCMKIKGF